MSLGTEPLQWPAYTPALANSVRHGSLGGEDSIGTLEDNRDFTTRVRKKGRDAIFIVSAVYGFDEITEQLTPEQTYRRQ